MWTELFMSGPTYSVPKVSRFTQVTEKTCRMCGETKGIIEFATQGAKDDGRKIYSSYCFPCHAKRNREARQRRKGNGL